MQRLATGDPLARWRAAALLGLLAACMLLPAMALGARESGERAGEVVLTVGDVEVLHAGGARAPLGRGEPLLRGDTVRTATNARVQILFTDGSRMSVRPGSEVDLTDYAYDPRVPADNRFRMRLRRGGFRTVTGGIGDLNRAGYRIDMPMSTIGVRGTEFGAGILPEGDAVGTTQGTVNQASGGGDLDTGPGSRFLYSLVSDPDLPPRGLDEPPGDLGAILELGLPAPSGASTDRPGREPDAPEDPDAGGEGGEGTGEDDSGAGTAGEEDGTPGSGSTVAAPADGGAPDPGPAPATPAGAAAGSGPVAGGDGGLTIPEFGVSLGGPDENGQTPVLFQFGNRCL